LDGTIVVIIVLGVAALVSKLIDSTLGLGYGTLLAPFLLILNFPVERVVPAILFSEFCVASVTAAFNQLIGNIDLSPFIRDVNIATVMAIFGIIGAIAAVFVALIVPHYSNPSTSDWSSL
jgi:uncharacterized membrane protein YfcA